MDKIKKCKCGKEIAKRFNSTIQNKLCPKCTLLELHSKPSRSTEHGHISTNEPKTTIYTTQKKKSVKSRKTKVMDFYSTTAWRWCAKYVLLFYADNNGNVSCSTSGRIYQVTDRNIQCGHFIKVKDGSSTNYSTALDFENLAPQCYQDNRYYAGKPDVMRKWLVEKHGEDAVRNLEIKKFNICKLDDLILSEFAKIYKAKFKELLVSRNIKNPWVKSDTHRTI